MSNAPSLRRGLAVLIGSFAVATVASLGLSPAAGAAPVPTAGSPSASPHATQAMHVAHACAPATKPGWASCLSLVRTDVTGHKGLFAPNATPGGYGPTDLQSAYDLPSATGGTGQTVAIVDAYDDPNAEADLQVYRAQYGLPECSTANGCFTKVNQQGEQGNYPNTDKNWSGEMSLDLDMVSAICPSCHILLVEADQPTMDSLGTAVNTAVALGAKFVSNSYGGTEDPSDLTGDSTYFNHPGVVVTASSGDGGYGVEYPAASPNVTAVGGTSLSRDSSSRGWGETVWSGAGSGCSAYEPKPSWQVDTGCASRTVADVAAVADPNTGVAVYDTFQTAGWQVFGGTSVAAPIIASTYALAGTQLPGSNPTQNLYDTPSALNDVTAGANGFCTQDYLCNGGPGYDGPTGLGTPNGTTAFQSTPHGLVSGTVTDAATGGPLSGARVDAGQSHATTGADGSYTLRAPAGSYSVTASKFGYTAKTVPEVQVSENQTTTENFSLAVLPTSTISGTVRDGSGHGWPVYAKVQVRGTTAVTYTDPKTGTYHLALPQGAAYPVEVDPVAAGYQQESSSVDVGTADGTHDVSVLVDGDTCAAPGYQFHYTEATQGFAGTDVPSGWTVLNAPGTTHGFEFDAPGGMVNNTGGSGNFAVANSAYYTSYEDTQLISPIMDLSHDTTPFVQWNQDLRMWQDDSAQVDLSLDGGTTWTNIYQWSDYLGSRPGPNRQAFAVPSSAGASQVRVRFHFVDSNALWWWAIDDVFIGNRVCQPVAGGLVAGTVTDRDTGDGINAATVTASGNAAVTATTMPTPDDPNLGDGFYELFTPSTGNQKFTVSAVGHRSTSASTRVSANSVTTLNVALRAK